MKKAISPKEVAVKKWKTLPWGEKWSGPFGFPAENAVWFVCGKSASGKSSFVMQLSKELCNYGNVLYVSYEEKVNQSFQRRMGYLDMNEVQGKFRVVTDDSYEELMDRLSKRKSPKFVVIDSFQESGWHEYPKAKQMVEMFPRKCFIFVSQEWKGQPAGKPAGHLRHLADVKVWVQGYKAFCQGRSVGEAGSYYVVWKDGVMRTCNTI